MKRKLQKCRTGLDLSIGKYLDCWIVVVCYCCDLSQVVPSKRQSSKKKRDFIARGRGN